MRYGKGPGGLKNIIQSERTQTQWALSHHVCNQHAMESEPHKVTVHKEEGKKKIEAVRALRDKLRVKLSSLIHPLDPTKHPEGVLVNIITGKIAPENVNVDHALELGTKQMKDFENSLPEGFRSTGR